MRLLRRVEWSGDDTCQRLSDVPDHFIAFAGRNGRSRTAIQSGLVFAKPNRRLGLVPSKLSDIRDDGRMLALSGTPNLQTGALIACTRFPKLQDCLLKGLVHQTHSTADASRGLEDPRKLGLRFLRLPGSLLASGFRSLDDDPIGSPAGFLVERVSKLRFPVQAGTDRFLRAS